jgi:hypothetical protein
MVQSQPPHGVQDQTGRDEAAGAGAAPMQSLRESPQTLIQESIKYRRRAQEAERRAEALDAEVQDLRQARDERGTALGAELAQAQAEAEALRGRLETLERDRQLERELARAGCGDTETVLALAHQRLAAGPPPEDLAAFARGLLEEKPHLRGEAGGAPTSGIPAARGLPPRTAAAKPAGDAAPKRAADRLADRARRSGNPTDLAAYMRARRSTGM